ncbi:MULTISPECIES: DUF4267 domain-containing protein [unclassified Modestobacter]|uniref:DUF4267 domain-containing protein n=1 Tax=unclassified Modestobacter TaxID=2643866 RepID=UPI0022AA931C|nr:MULTISPECIES: DUF4267 domain-containing protein [unclassified Modestobacter]MCZ2820483.1 DUF4267 domain-containing protein [Modestobacter sp. VKM Ac-2977]MCZ2848700.1 DUF4267 domain-containing protein [Modestobacter sp. VKM Ac-2978]
MTLNWDVTRKSIGTLSIWLGTGALFAPRAMTRALGVDERATGNDIALPLLVRLIAARNIAMGAALLVTPVPQARRTTEVTLLLTALDGAAVLVGRRGGDVADRSVGLSMTVLGLAAAGAAHWHRR